MCQLLDYILINEIISLFFQHLCWRTEKWPSLTLKYTSQSVLNMHRIGQEVVGGRRTELKTYLVICLLLHEGYGIRLIVAWIVIKIDLISPTNQLVFNFLSMSNQRWTNVRHRRWYDVENRLDMQVESTLISDVDSTLTFQRRFHLHIQHFLNVTSTSKYDVDSTLFQRVLPAGQCFIFLSTYLE